MINTYIVPEDRIIHKTMVDFSFRAVPDTIYIVQYDKKLPIIEVQLFSNKEQYVIPSDIGIRVRVGKKDHTYVYKPVLGCNEDRTTVYFEVDEQMSYYHGPINPKLEIFKMENNEYLKAGSSSIPITIERNPIQETDIESNVDDTIIDQIHEIVSEAVEKSNQALSQVDSKVTKNNPITGATKTKITYDSKGLVTGGADLAVTDITNFDNEVLALSPAGARTPTAHTHVKADITDFAHEHSWGDITDKPTTFPIDEHTHIISEITNLQEELDKKVDKVPGKQLSTEDYTTAEKTKLKSADNTHIGENAPTQSGYNTWLRPMVENQPPEVYTEIEENSIEAELEEIETEPMLNEIESVELNGDEIITPPQFE